MENIKVKVNLPKKVYDMLINDMEAFGFIKENGEINKNNFINTLIKNYFPIFSKREIDAIKRIKKESNINEEQFRVITNMLFEEGYKKDENYSKEIQFLISKDNNGIYEEIIALYLNNRSLSQYFREMFIMYSSIPQDNREQVIFKDIVNKIKENIASNLKAIIALKDKKMIKLNIFELANTREGMFTYLLGVSEDKKVRQIVSYHLKDITNVISIPNEIKEISDSEKEKLELTEFQNPAFPVDEVIDAIVELSEVGVKLFNLYIHDRPHPYKIENKKYYFKGSMTHLIIYFFKFANEAIFISPNKIKEFLVYKFIESAKIYK